MFSLLIKRNIGLNSVIKKINGELQEFCKIYNFNCISNDEIGRSFLCGDGVHLSGNGIDILAGNFVNNANSTVFKRFFNWGNLNWQERLHDEQQGKVGTLSVQSNDCHSSEQTLLTSYDIDMLMKTRKTYKKSHTWVPKHKFLKNQDFKSERNIT